MLSQSLGVDTPEIGCRPESRGVAVFRVAGGNRWCQIENDIPQPQVVAALGLLITNRDPCRSSR